MKGKSYWVSEITRYIKHVFDADYALNHVQVKGEISNCKYHSSGHIYFTLKDEGSQIACVMFAANRTQGLKFRLQEGQSVVVSGNITIYERDGKYQLYARQITLDGAGELYEKFMQLKQKLEEEGLFAKEYKQAIPFYSRKVGVVTAVTGAAIRDIENIAKRRNPYVQLVLYPAQVQGQGAAESIVHGIQTLDKMDMDVIIVGRGGGSIEDLWAFNEEIVARAIFDCFTPVISSVGHETDVTIADFVADLRAPTPSAAAELAVCDIREVLMQIKEYGSLFRQRMEWKVLYKRQHLEQYRLRVDHGNPTRQIQQKRQRILDLEEKIERQMCTKLEKKKHLLAIYIERLQGACPLRKLNQGFSYVQDCDKKQSVKSIRDVKVGQEVRISVTDGDILAKVEKVEEVLRK